LWNNEKIKEKLFYKNGHDKQTFTGKNFPIKVLPI
jgi:hypothetical protein